MPLQFKFLEAGKGDSILLFIDDKVIIIDGGDSFDTISLPINNLKRERKNIDLMVLTHQDDDHILGLLHILRDKNYRQMVFGIWFNSFENDNIFSFRSSDNTSTRSAIKFHEFACKMKEDKPDFYYEDYICTETNCATIDLPSTKINILSPTPEKLEILEKKYLAEKEKLKTSFLTSKNITKRAVSIEELYLENPDKDSSVTNGSSIAFLLTYKNKHRFLLLGDAHIDVIINSLYKLKYSKTNKVKLNFIKLSHHGCVKNINQDFLDIVDVNIFIILTNGTRYNHPDPETLALIIMNPERKVSDKITFLFNYKNVIESLCKLNAFSKYNMDKYNFSLEYTGNVNFSFE